jgi:hypothetical protein
MSKSFRVNLRLTTISGCISVITGLAAASCKAHNINNIATPTSLPPMESVEGMADTGLVTNEPCPPPCWQNIYPGDSQEGVNELVSELPVIDIASVVIGSDSTCWNGGCIRFYAGRVEAIDYVLAYRLELQDLIRIRGEPDGFTISYQPEVATVISIDLLWPQQGLGVSVEPSDDFRQTSEGVPVTPESLVTAAMYFEPVANAEEWFLRFVGPSEREGESILEYHHYYEWKGYVPLPQD